MKNKILITGSSGRFGASLKKIKTKHKLICPTRKQMNITKINSIKSYLKKNKAKNSYSFSRSIQTYDTA